MLLIVAVFLASVSSAVSSPVLPILQGRGLFADSVVAGGNVAVPLKVEFAKIVSNRSI